MFDDPLTHALGLCSSDKKQWRALSHDTSGMDTGLEEIEADNAVQ